MKRVGYFCTDGYTELVGLKPFLQKINPHVNWERCFPAKLKLRPGMDPNELQPRGTTGDDLLSAMREFLSFGCEYDFLLLVDDADCRFYGMSNEDIQTWHRDLQGQIDRILGREVPLICLFASPEMEAWFVADWNNSFGEQFREIHHCLNQRVKQILSDDWENPEEYGGERRRGACENKLSEQIQEAVRYCGGHFSKNIDGGEMLSRIDPARVAVRCTKFLAPVFERLRDELHVDH